MGYYSDPTASRALGPINREFSRQEKKAKTLCKLYLNGKLSQKGWEAARSQFRGIFRHVPENALREELEKRKAGK